MTITDESREELAEALHHLAEQAKAEARRGWIGVHGARYETLHGEIDYLITRLEQMPCT